jgi:lysophospholipase L1-like esterase
MRWPRATVAGTALALAAAELALRALGLHTPVLYEPTPYGYRARPDQELKRFGNRIAYNQFGMRSAAVAPQPSPGTLRVLCVGDSVTNGGALIDQEDTWPRQLERRLGPPSAAVEVLNASAPGWATANERRWLDANGSFGAALVVLAIGTHDLFQPPAGSDLVDSHPSFPSRAPLLATQEALRHYILPWLGFGAAQDPGTWGVEPEAAAAVASIANVLGMAERARRDRAVFMVLYFDEEGPLAASAAAAQARRQLVAALGRASIPMIDLRGAVERLGRDALYRDEVHPTAAGNRAIAATLAEALTRQFPELLNDHVAHRAGP